MIIRQAKQNFIVLIKSTKNFQIILKHFKSFLFQFNDSHKKKNCFSKNDISIMENVQTKHIISTNNIIQQNLHFNCCNQ